MMLGEVGLGSSMSCTCKNVTTKRWTLGEESMVVRGCTRTNRDDGNSVQIEESVVMVVLVS